MNTAYREPSASSVLSVSGKSYQVVSNCTEEPFVATLLLSPVGTCDLDLRAEPPHASAAAPIGLLSPSLACSTSPGFTLSVKLCRFQSAWSMAIVSASLPLGAGSMSKSLEHTLRPSG